MASGNGARRVAKKLHTCGNAERNGERMILDPVLTKAIADLDAAAKRLVKATAPNLCIDCAEPCGYLDQRCAICKARHERDEKRLAMLERYSGCFDLIDQEDLDV